MNANTRAAGQLRKPDPWLADEIRVHRALARAGTIVDGGAADGQFAFALCARDRKVLAFEPRPDAADQLASLARAHGANIAVHPAALASAAGVALLSWPLTRPTWATLRAAQCATGAIVQARVQLIALDSLRLTHVSAIKLDVEGNELDALRGMRKTLDSCRPLLSVELEERHCAGCTHDVPAWLAQAGYRVYFRAGGALWPAAVFSAREHQALRADSEPRWPTGPDWPVGYINTFYAVHESDSVRDAQLRALGAGIG